MLIEVTFNDTRLKERFEVPGTTCIVGRSLNANVSIKREELSRNHFQIDYENGEFYITDLNSTNGVKVNGERLAPGVKTPYKSIFPLEIAEMVTISLSMEEDNEPVFQNNARSAQPVAETSASATRTTKLPKPKTETPAYNPSYESKRETNEPKSKNTLMAAGIVILALAFGFYYMTPSEDVPSTDSEAALATSSNLEALKQDPAKIPELDVNQLNFKSLITQTQCPDFGELCQTVGLKNPYEGIAIIDNKMLIYVNLEKFPKEGLHSEFLNLSEQEQAEFIMANYGTHPALTPELMKKKPSHLLVVGFNAIDEIIQLKYLLNISYHQLPPMDQDLHRYVFGELLYGGTFRPYKKYIGYYSKISEI